MLLGGPALAQSCWNLLLQLVPSTTQAMTNPTISLFIRKLQQDLKYEVQYKERLWNRFLQDFAQQSVKTERLQ